MIILCAHCYLKDINLSDWLAIIIALFALSISIATYYINAKPVLIFIYSDTKSIYQIKNVGNAPALNLKVLYSISETNIKWINPVKCYSIKAGDTIDLDWLIYKKETLILKKGEEQLKSSLNNKDIETVGGGMGKYAVVYTSAFPLFFGMYTSMMAGDEITVYSGNMLGQIVNMNCKSIWQLEKKKEN